MQFKITAVKFVMFESPYFTHHCLMYELVNTSLLFNLNSYLKQLLVALRSAYSLIYTPRRLVSVPLISTKQAFDFKAPSD